MTATLVTEDEVAARIERKRRQLREDRRFQMYARKHGITLTPVRDKVRQPVPPHAAPLGSEPTLRDDEAVCSTTHLTYNRWMPCPHHYDGTEPCSNVGRVR